MTLESTTQIKLEAAQALVDWKSQFANLVRDGGRKIAATEGAGEVTLKHYQQAAEQAIIELGVLIQTGTNPNERRHAA